MDPRIRVCAFNHASTWFGDVVWTGQSTRHIRAAYDHAGLTQEQRRDAQEKFSSERCDLVIATVAFGMGIDRSNVRFVLHTAMPKSIEHYQQETGRAGRDGLEAECVLLYSGGDVVVWKTMLERSDVELSRDYLRRSIIKTGNTAATAHDAGTPSRSRTRGSSATTFVVRVPP